MHPPPFLPAVQPESLTKAGLVWPIVMVALGMYVWGALTKPCERSVIIPTVWRRVYEHY